MKQKQVTAVHKEFIEIVEMLNLHWWIPQCGYVPSCPDLARIHMTHGQHTAWLELGKPFKRLSPTERRQTLVHEALHLAVRDLVSTVPSLLAQTKLPRGEQRLVQEALRLQEELVVDDLASALVAFL